MPIAYSFLATSLEAMEKHFENTEVSSLLYVYMAQPLAKNAPSFCLCMFGNRNVFKAIDVIKRWDYIEKSLNEQGITVMGKSGDGDPRLLKAMRFKSNLGVQRPNKYKLNNIEVQIKGFHANISTDSNYIQDVAHIGAKLRANYLKPSKIIPMGKSVATPAHVKIIMKNFSKDKHCLAERDLNGKDKMNFASVIRLSRTRLIKLISENVAESEATCQYLQIIQYVVNAFLSTSLTIRDRIYYMWYSTFFLRLWRRWLDLHPDYTVTDNFISANTYICIELNAHGMLNAIFRCMEVKSFEQFLPWMFSSQPCESFFRGLRSMTSTFSTIVNSTLLETMYKLRRMQVLNDIFAYDFTKKNQHINFPRRNFLHASFETLNDDLPSSPVADIACSNDSDFTLGLIEEIIARAEMDAHKACLELNMEIDIAEASKMRVKNIINDSALNILDDDEVQTIEHQNGDEASTDPLEDSQFVQDPREGQSILADCDDLQNADLTQDAQSLDGPSDGPIEELSTRPSMFANCGDLEFATRRKSKGPAKNDRRFTVYKNQNGEDTPVLKSSICWLLNQSAGKLSNDRLQRVQEIERKKKSVRRDLVLDTQVCEEVHLGDWCLFEIPEQEAGQSKCLIGLVLQFAYLEERVWRKISYSSEYARVQNNSQTIGVLCTWYRADRGQLVAQPMSTHGYIDIAYYRLTIPAPTRHRETHCLSDEVFDEIKEYI